MQRWPYQKQSLQFDRMPLFVTLDMRKVELDKSSLTPYVWFSALGLGIVFLIVILMLRKEQKPDAKIRQKSRDNFYRRRKGKRSGSGGQPHVDNAVPPPAEPAAPAPEPPATASPDVERPPAEDATPESGNATDGTDSGDKPKTDPPETT